MNRLTPAQMRGARGMLDWSMIDLAGKARLSVSTVKRMETVGLHLVSSKPYAAVLAALEDAGMRFFKADGEIGIAFKVG